MRIYFLFLLSFCLSNKLIAQNEQEQRIQASYILAFNKPATSGDVNYWKTQGNLSITQLLAKHKEYIAGNRSVWNEILKMSFTDAYGRGIKNAEYTANINFPKTYVEMMNVHLQILNAYPTIYDQVVTDSYKSALHGKNLSVDELKYWAGQTKLAYIWLFRAHLEYAATQKRSKAAMNGVKYFSVTPAILSETRRAVTNLIGMDGSGLVGNEGSSLLAAGGGNLAGNSGNTIIAAGGAN